MLALSSPRARHRLRAIAFPALACVLAAGLAPLAASAQDGAPTYRVAGVADDDKLNIRSGPSSEHAIVGSIPPSGRGIRLTGNCGAWCPVHYNGLSGWVSGRYLAVETAVAPFVQRGDLPSHWRVTGVADHEVLLVRNNPSPLAPVVYVYAPRATCIVLAGGCQRPWCQVQIPAQGGQQTGWVDSKFLAPADEPCRQP